MFLTRLALRQGHGYIAQSDQVRRDLFTVLPGHRSRRRWSPRRIRSTISGIPGRPRKTQGRGAPCPGTCRPTARLVLFFGFIKPYKGVVHLIDAAGPLQGAIRRRAAHPDRGRYLRREATVPRPHRRLRGPRTSSSWSTASFPTTRSRTISWRPTWRFCPTCRPPRAASSRSPTTTTCRWSRPTWAGCPRWCWTAGPVSSCPAQDAAALAAAVIALLRGGQDRGIHRGGGARKREVLLGPHGRGDRGTGPGREDRHEPRTESRRPDRQIWRPGRSCR